MSNIVAVAYDSYKDPILGPLSTYSDFPVKISDVEYPTAEHAIQVLRAVLVGKLKLARRIFCKKTPHECNRLGETAYKKEYSDAEKVIWLNQQVSILYDIFMARVEQNQVVKTCLLNTPGSLLVAYNRDLSMEERYPNIYGVIHTVIRTELRSLETDFEEKDVSQN